MHRVVLLASYAFSVWMCVDAYKRGMQGWWFVIILLPFGEWIYFFVVKIQDYRDPSGFISFGPRMKCSNCRYCVALYRDGVQCQIGENRPIFKNMSHVNFCTMHEER